MSSCRPRAKGVRSPGRSWTGSSSSPLRECKGFPNCSRTCCRWTSVPGASLLVASSNRGKLSEFRELASSAGGGIHVDALAGFDRVPPFEESAETFAENAAGKAMYYSRASDELVIADDSGLVVQALGGEPGVRSSRYAGPEGDARKNIAKLVGALAGKTGAERAARFVCVLA